LVKLKDVETRCCPHEANDREKINNQQQIALCMSSIYRLKFWLKMLNLLISSTDFLVFYKYKK